MTHPIAKIATQHLSPLRPLPNQTSFKYPLVTTDVSTAAKEPAAHSLRGHSETSALTGENFITGTALARKFVERTVSNNNQSSPTQTKMALISSWVGNLVPSPLRSLLSQSECTFTRENGTVTYNQDCKEPKKETNFTGVCQPSSGALTTNNYERRVDCHQGMLDIAAGCAVTKNSDPTPVTEVDEICNSEREPLKELEEHCEVDSPSELFSAGTKTLDKVNCPNLQQIADNAASGEKEKALCTAIANFLLEVCYKINKDNAGNSPLIGSKFEEDPSTLSDGKRYELLLCAKKDVDMCVNQFYIPDELRVLDDATAKVFNDLRCIDRLGENVELDSSSFNGLVCATEKTLAEKLGELIGGVTGGLIKGIATGIQNTVG